MVVLIYMAKIRLTFSWSYPRNRLPVMRKPRCQFFFMNRLTLNGGSTALKLYYDRYAQRWSLHGYTPLATAANTRRRVAGGRQQSYTSECALLSCNCINLKVFYSSESTYIYLHDNYCVSVYSYIYRYWIARVPDSSLATNLLTFWGQTCSCFGCLTAWVAM